MALARVQNSEMRTTIEVSPDVVAAAGAIAADRGESIDEEDDLYNMNSSFPEELPIVINPRSGFPMFDQPADAPLIRSEVVEDAMDEEE